MAPGPSAAIVLADLAELGVRRAIRVGTCSALTPELRSGDLLNIAEAHAWGMPLGAFAPGSPWVGDLDGDGCLDLLVPRHSPEPGTNDGLLTRFKVAASVPPTTW